MKSRLLAILGLALASLVALIGCEGAGSTEWKENQKERSADVQVDESGDK